jgi:hypothetical protein
VRFRFIFMGALFASLTVAQAAEYRTDSGISDNSLGLTNGGEIAWLQAFTVTGGNNVITSISTTFGTPAFPGDTGLTAGTAFSVYVWRGTPTGTGADLPTLIAEAAGTVSAGSIDTDVFQSVAINAVITGTNNFFIGASINHAASTFVAPLQQTGTGAYPILNTSWVAGSNTAGGFDPNNLAGGIGVFNMTAASFAGNWLIRAEAVPEPMTMITMAGALGALALRRRRRKL